MQHLPAAIQRETYQHRHHNGPVVALAALVAVLHLSVLAGRLGRRAVPRSCDVLAWQVPTAGPTDEPASEQSPSNPIRPYNAGQLALGTGIAVVALTAWLRVMRMNGAHGR